jgi:ribonuclease HI
VNVYEGFGNAPEGTTKSIKLYSDGASRGNGKGKSICAYAYYAKYEGYEMLNGKAFRGYTNNQMEILGLIRGLEHITNKKIPVKVYLDSKYVYNAVTQHWIYSWKRQGWTKKGGLKNTRYWQVLLREIEKFDMIEYYWVKGHASNFGNNTVDEECNKLMDNYIKGEMENGHKY